MCLSQQDILSVSLSLSYLKSFKASLWSPLVEKKYSNTHKYKIKLNKFQKFKIVCQEWNSNMYKNVHRSNKDIISTSKQKVQQTDLQSSGAECTVQLLQAKCYIHIKWFIPQHDLKKTTDISGLHDRLLAIRVPQTNMKPFACRRKHHEHICTADRSGL